MTTRGRDVGVGERAGEDEGAEDGRGRGAGFNSPSRSMRCARRETRDAAGGAMDARANVQRCARGVDRMETNARD